MDQIEIKRLERERGEYRERAHVAEEECRNLKNQLTQIAGALRNHNTMCKPDCTLVRHIEGVYADLEECTQRMRELLQEKRLRERP